MFYHCYLLAIIQTFQQGGTVSSLDVPELCTQSPSGVHGNHWTLRNFIEIGSCCGCIEKLLFFCLIELTKFLSLRSDVGMLMCLILSFPSFCLSF